MPSKYPEWQRLEDLLDAVKAGGFKPLGADEIIEFGKLYRRAAAELSFYRTHEADAERLDYLNELVGKCYPYVYAAPRKPWPSVRRFYTVDFPRAIRRHVAWILLATMLFLLPAAISFLITFRDPAVAEQVLIPEFVTAMKGIVNRHHTPKDWVPALQRGQAAGMIMTNNIGVTLLSYAGGMGYGILTIFLLVTNGVMLGTIGAGVALDGAATSLNFWGFVAPHGVLELTAIFIAGGAGFILAYALIVPGGVPRRITLRKAGKESLTLMLGVTSMLVVAGTIEGFFSPSVNVPDLAKLVFATVEAVLMLSYFTFAGRRTAEVEEKPYGTLMTPLPPV